MRHLREGEGGLPLKGGTGGDLRGLLRPADAGVEHKGGGAMNPIDPHAGPEAVM